MFGVTKFPAFGTFGEFNIGNGQQSVRARYILTKMRPGSDGSWESSLASNMVPWREVFNVEELSFDELLQRDLDDSRVAHDLIPYLLGNTGDEAKFFPPILAVVVPKKDQGTGIKAAYPLPKTPVEAPQRQEFGDLFDFEQIYWKEGDKPAQPTPLAKLDYNPQRAAFMIVDGQHRAMAILALHRQLTSTWKGSAYASYYSHIAVTPDQVKSIELPVCIIFFPDLHEGSEFVSKGMNLISVCRDIFLVVNRNAKPVTESRSVLLDDEDLPARLMRQTLSALKDRSVEDYGVSRIYSISYGDSDADLSKQVVHGQLDYSSAIALHKIHAAISFGRVEAFGWNATIDITNGQNSRNSSRPAEILLGTSAEHLPTVSRRSGKALPPKDVREVVKGLGGLTDIALLNLFDKFRPFNIHNRTMRTLRDRLSDPHIQADPVQKKCLSLIFEGSGIRNVFESHVARLKAIREERIEEGQPVGDNLVTQINFCDSVTRALTIREAEVHKARACAFFQMDQTAFYPPNTNPTPEQSTLEEKARKVFQTASTQAFQLGYCMALFTAIEDLKRQNSSSAGAFQYDQRKELVSFVSDVFLAGLNKFLSPEETAIHKTLTGFVKESRAAIFDQQSFGLRGLFAMRGGELNERSWPFFRFVVLEMIHSKYAWPAAAAAAKAKGGWAAEWYRVALPSIVNGIIADRDKYVLDAVNARLKDSDFQSTLVQKKHQAEGAGKSADEITSLIAQLEEEKRKEAQATAAAHLKASLDVVETKEEMLARLQAELPEETPA